MRASSNHWLQPLRSAYEEPWLVAERLRSQGTRVVGVLGWSVPRELIVAAGLAPVRLSARRLYNKNPIDEIGACRADDRLARLAAVLSPPTAAVLQALLDGSLGWLDALVIGRDNESHTRLFYILRELAAQGERLLPFAFFDLLRLPYRTSAIYNRRQARELLCELQGWSGRVADAGRLAWADAQQRELQSALGRLASLRGRVPAALSGSAMLTVAGAAQVLPGEELLEMLAPAQTHDVCGDAGGGPRVFVSGSGLDDLWFYRVLEDVGVNVVGEDHEWGPAALGQPSAAADPLDSIVDRYHYAPGGAARAGLSERVALTALRARSLHADAVLHIAFAHDEAPKWECAELQALLGDMPLLRVQLPYWERRPQMLLDAIAPILEGPSDG